MESFSCGSHFSVSIQEVMCYGMGDFPSVRMVHLIGEKHSEITICSAPLPFLVAAWMIYRDLYFFLCGTRRMPELNPRCFT